MQAYEERTVENLLLKERRNLIDRNIKRRLILNPIYILYIYILNPIYS